VRQRLAQAGAAFALACCLGGMAPAALAQSSSAAAPSTKQMIEALLPSGTKGRNLLVRQSADTPAAAASGATPAAPTAPAAPAAAEPAPSLSLAIQFEANSSRVRPESGGLLGDLVAAMISPELKDTRFVIEGHTDARGNAAANRRLSQERAEEVRQYLMLLGVHASRLKAVGKGSSEPANTKDPLAAENRRVRVVTVQ
jgi:outer membrane protein OmpA-like peptidoglycan-associated protein